MSDLPEHVRINREAWTRRNAEYTDGRAQHSWSQEVITWGVWGVPESELGVLPEVSGKDVIELGCGTAYFGAWLKRHGARRVVGIDITPAQLATARRMDAEFGLGLELIEASAEAVPLASGQFDLALSEYGASIWCDPELWIREAARLLRSGGELVFLRNSTLAMLCIPDTGQAGESLLRSQRDLARLEWYDEDPGVEFHPPAGELLRLLVRSGFDVLDLRELSPPAGAEPHTYYDYVPLEWARRWPAEEIWRARKR